MHIEEVLPPEVVRRKLAKVDLVEAAKVLDQSRSGQVYERKLSAHDGGRVVDAIEADDGRDKEDERKDGPVDLAPGRLDIFWCLSSESLSRQYRSRCIGRGRCLRTGRHAPHSARERRTGDARCPR